MPERRRFPPKWWVPFQGERFWGKPAGRGQTILPCQRMLARFKHGGGKPEGKEGEFLLTPETKSIFVASPSMMNSLIERLRARRSLRASSPPSRDDRLISCALCMRLIEKPAGGEKQLTWDIYFNYNVSAYYAENAGDVHTGACGAGDGGCVSGAPRGGKCEKMALSPPGADGPQIKWGGSPRRQYETDLSTQEETEKQSARFP